jgi:hypothetical protein
MTVAARYSMCRVFAIPPDVEVAAVEALTTFAAGLRPHRLGDGRSFGGVGTEVVAVDERLAF